MATRTDYAVCMLCEASCGIEVEHDGERVLRVRGDAKDPFSRGHICPKGTALADVQNDPDRIRRPLRRVGDDWVEVSWDDALDEVATRLHSIQERHGRDSVAVYTGNPLGHDYAGFLIWERFKEELGSQNLFSATSVDALPLVLKNTLVFGNQGIVPVPDIDRTDFLLVLGANPVVSNGSAMTAPDVTARLRAIRERGGRLVVIDPRRTETAKVADTHYFIRPGTDALLLAAMVRTLFAEGRIDPGPLLARVDGFDTLPELLDPFTPERVASAVGIAADEIVQLTRDFASAESAACYGRMGTCTQEFGLLATWLIDVLNLATGNLDRPGGSMFNTPAVDLVSLAGLLDIAGKFDRRRSRVSDLPDFNGELPVTTFAEEIETPGEGQIRALVTHCGNPLLSLPGAKRLERAFEGLEFVVAIDIYLNETTRHADLILPPLFGLEREHYSLVQHGTAVRDTAHYAHPVLDRPADGLDSWQVTLEIVKRLGRLRGGASGLRSRAVATVLGWLEPRGLLRLLLRLGPQHATLGELELARHGLDFGPLRPRLERLLGKKGRIRLVPDPIRNDLPRLRTRLDQPYAQGPNGLVLINRRTLRSNNSWMHNSERLVKGRDRCVLLMNPDDAERRGLGSESHVVVKSAVGEIEVPLEITEEIGVGVVSLPHGWGHDRPGSRLSVASLHAGRNVNELSDESAVDPASGTSILFGVPVTVDAVAAP